MIAQGLSPLAPESVQIKAGKLFLGELERHLEQKENFCFETTLSGSSYLQKIRRWKKDGWHVSPIIFGYLIPIFRFASTGTGRSRGHDIPHEAILRRYDKSLRHLFHYLPICDEVMCYDNSDSSHSLIFTMEQGEIEVMNETLCRNIQQKLY